MKARLLLLVLVVVAWGAGGALAAAQEEDAAYFTVPFQFQATGQAHPAGTYQLRVNEDRMGFTLVPRKGGMVELAVTTRLAEPEHPLEKGKVVFDKVGEEYYLSEVWLPGEDGFLLHATKGKHTHELAAIEKRKE